MSTYQAEAAELRSARATAMAAITASQLTEMVLALYRGSAEANAWLLEVQGRRELWDLAPQLVLSDVPEISFYAANVLHQASPLP